MSTTTAPATTFADRMVAAIEAHDIEAIVALYRPDGTQVHPFADEVVEGIDAIREGDGALVRAFPDARVERRTEVRVGDTVLMEVVLHMTHAGPLDLPDGSSLPPTGRPVTLPLVWVIDLDADERIVQERSYLDPSAFYAQLGLQA